jgi:hypothetical protein
MILLTTIEIGDNLTSAIIALAAALAIVGFFWALRD